MGKILYINDYGCDNESLNACQNLKFPSNHTWGISDLYRKNGDIRICHVKHCKGFKRLWQLLSVYFKNCCCDVVYSALPGYEWGFLLAKRLGIKNYNIVTVVHHPLSRLPLPNQYNRLVYIGKEVYEKFGKKYDNSEYLFWGPDIDFYPPPII